jgi:hypothetical protein
MQVKWFGMIILVVVMIIPMGLLVPHEATGNDHCVSPDGGDANLGTIDLHVPGEILVKFKEPMADERVVSLVTSALPHYLHDQRTGIPSQSAKESFKNKLVFCSIIPSR